MKQRTVFRVHLTLEKGTEVHDGEAWCYDSAASLAEIELINTQDEQAAIGYFKIIKRALKNAGFEGEEIEGTYIPYSSTSL